MTKRSPGPRETAAAAVAFIKLLLNLSGTTIPQTAVAGLLTSFLDEERVGGDADPAYNRELESLGLIRDAFQELDLARGSALKAPTPAQRTALDYYKQIRPEDTALQTVILIKIGQAAVRFWEDYTAWLEAPNAADELEQTSDIHLQRLGQLIAVVSRARAASRGAEEFDEKLPKLLLEALSTLVR